MELLVILSVFALGFAIIPLIGAGAALFGAEQSRKAAKRQAKAMEAAAEPQKKEQAFMEELRRGFLDERTQLLRKTGGYGDLLDYYLENLAVLREGLASKFQQLAQQPSFYAGQRLALAEASGLNTEAARRMVSALVGSGGVRGSAVARALAGEEVRRQQQTERQLAELARQEALEALQMQQQASQLRESIVRERFQMPLALEEALANRALGIGSSIAGMAQASTAAQLQAQQFLAQQEGLRAQQLAQGIAGLAQAYQQQQMMKRYYDLMRNNPYLAAYTMGGGYGIPPFIGGF